MKKAVVFLRDIQAGILTEDENGYTFQYDADFLTSDHAEAISLTLPLTNEPFNSKVLFPFFDGLIPEGWLLNIAENNWKIDGIAGKNKSSSSQPDSFLGRRTLLYHPPHRPHR